MQRAESPTPTGGRVRARSGGRLEVEWGGRTVWRSQRRYVVGGFGDVRRYGAAFALWFRGNLLLVPPGGPERLVARDEFPLGWTARGSLVTSRMGRGRSTLTLRDRRGLARAAYGVRGPFAWDRDRGRAVLIEDGRLVAWDGRRRVLADLRGERLRSPWLAPLAGDFVAVQTARRLLIVRGDGTITAATTLPDGTQSGGPVANEDGVVAFAVSRGHRGRRTRGSESVYALRPGDREPTLLYRHSFRFALCERGASLSWYGPWLLYQSTEGRLVALETTEPRRRVDLSRTLARLPGGWPDGQGKVSAWARWEPRLARPRPY